MRWNEAWGSSDKRPGRPLPLDGPKAALVPMHRLLSGFYWRPPAVAPSIEGAGPGLDTVADDEAKTMKTRFWMLLTGALLVAACRPQPTGYEGFESFDRCEPAFGTALTALGVWPDQVRQRTYTVRRSFDSLGGRFGGRDGEVSGYEGWFRLRDCSGYLVVTADRYCRIIQAYTRGDCSVPGIQDFGN